MISSKHLTIVNKSVMKVDILAIGSHPDDVELGCSGTIAKEIAKGKRAGILDLTRGELGTRGNAEIRESEAKNAADILGASFRENLSFKDGFFKNDESHQLKLINAIRKYRPDIAVSGDFIVGFPGETEADFEATLDIVKKVKYAHAYSFKYSPRPGTPAALKDDQIDEEIKSDRLKILQELIKQQTRDFNSGFLEKIIDVLVEKKGIGENRLTGRSSYLQPVHMTGHARFIGEILKVKIIKTRDNSLEGVIL